MKRLSGTGFVTPFLTFKVSKVIEACKRFGRGCKPRPALGYNASPLFEPYVMLKEPFVNTAEY